MLVNVGLKRFVSASGLGGSRRTSTFMLDAQATLIPGHAGGSTVPTFTRATTATVMGYAAAANLIDGQTLLTAASGEARFQGARRISEGVWSTLFADGTAIPDATLKGYLSELAGTNLCLQSNAFTTSPWVDDGAACAQNVTGPDGVSNSAWTLTDNDALATEGRSQSFALSAQTYTRSIFVKKTTGAQSSYPVITAYTTLPSLTAALCTIDTSNGAATIWTALTGATITTSSATCVSFNADFWKVTLTFLGTAQTWITGSLPAATTNATQSTGVTDVTAQGTAVFYGASLVTGPVDGSYIATTTLAVTRNADVDTYVTSGNIPTSGAFVIAGEFTPNTADTSADRVLWSSYTDASNWTRVLYNTASGFHFERRVAASTTRATIAYAPAIGTTAKYSVRFSATSGLDCWLNGTKGTNNATTTQPVFAATMQLGADNSLLQPYAAIGNLRIYGRDLSDSQCAALSV